MAEKKLGLIGCGEFGRRHVACVSKIRGGRFAAFADVNLQAAEQLAQRYQGDYATSNAERLLCDPQIDAVYICTHHDSHASLAIRAARAGKHIFIEKPLALTMGECEAIASVVEKEGVMLMPGFKLRFFPLVERARAFIPQPVLVVGQMMDNRWPDDSWIQHPEAGGANVFSQGCHTTDLLRYFAGSEAQWVTAVGGMVTHPEHPMIDHCVASIRFANGVLGSWVQGDAAVGGLTSKMFFQVFGHGRSVQLHDRLTTATFFDGKKVWTETADEAQGLARENEAFVTALQSGQPPELTVHDGVAATRIVCAADCAIRTGQPQALAAMAATVS